VGARPAAQRVRGAGEPAAQVRAAGRAVLDRGTHVVEGLDEQRGEQGVAAGEVAVDRGGGHLEVAGDLADRERGRPDLGQLDARALEDGPGQLGPGQRAGGAGCGRHVPILARYVSTAYKCDQCS
jgi:hypothetical protein